MSARQFGRLRRKVEGATFKPTHPRRLFKYMLTALCRDLSALLGGVR